MFGFLVTVPVVAFALLPLADPPKGTGYDAFPGFFEGVPAPRPPSDMVALYVPGEDTLAVTTGGSSGCPVYPVEQEQLPNGSIRLRMKDYGDKACTADYAPYTTLLRVDTAANLLTVRLEAWQVSAVRVIRVRALPERTLDRRGR